MESIQIFGIPIFDELLAKRVNTWIISQPEHCRGVIRIYPFSVLNSHSNIFNIVIRLQEVITSRLAYKLPPIDY